MASRGSLPPGSALSFYHVVLRKSEALCFQGLADKMNTALPSLVRPLLVTECCHLSFCVCFSTLLRPLLSRLSSGLSSMMILAAAQTHDFLQGISNTFVLFLIFMIKFLRA
jgi:hypothetical protein